MKETQEIRALCYQMAQKSFPQADANRLIEAAKEIECYLWGGMQPIENPPSVFSHISEAALATEARLKELVQNTVGTKRKEVAELLPQWQRFMADMERALGSLYS